jgi:hypothetical protein
MSPSIDSEKQEARRWKIASFILIKRQQRENPLNHPM